MRSAREPAPWLAADGVPVVPTVVVPHGTEPAWDELFARFGDVVLKPAVSAGSFATIRVARGDALPETGQEAILQRFESGGHAIEARLCAEDPARDFLPQSGRVLEWRPGDAIRVDHALESGAAVANFALFKNSVATFCGRYLAWFEGSGDAMRITKWMVILDSDTVVDTVFLPI